MGFFEAVTDDGLPSSSYISDDSDDSGGAHQGSVKFYVPYILVPSLAASSHAARPEGKPQPKPEAAPRQLSLASLLSQQ